jgi:hypothetical protein
MVDFSTIIEIDINFTSAYYQENLAASAIKNPSPPL